MSVVDPLDRWNHLTPPTKYSISFSVRLWKVEIIFQKLKELIKGRNGNKPNK